MPQPGHAEPHGYFTEKGRITQCDAATRKICADEEAQGINTRPRSRWQNGAVEPPVLIGDGFSQGPAVAIFETNKHPLGRTAMGRVENMGGKG